jgi:hypothetical protein
MAKTVSTKAIAAALGVARKTVLERAEREQWLCRQTPQGNQWLADHLPREVRNILLRAEIGPTPPAIQQDAPQSRLFERATDREKEAALLRLDIITEFKRSKKRKEEFVEAFNEGCVSADLQKRLGAPLTVRTLYRHLRQYREAGGIGGLVPQYSAASGGPGASLSSLEKNYLMRFYLKESQPNIKDAWALMRANIKESRCSYNTARLFLGSLPPAIVDFFRLGTAAYTDRHQPYVDRDIEAFASLDCVVSDHHCLDCVCLCRGVLVRPWITTFQDYRSGKILGWCLCLNPSSYSIIAAYYRTCIAYGIPRALVFDNGKDYRSKLLNGSKETVRITMPDGSSERIAVDIAGVLPLVGSEVHFTETYNGKSKGRQEHWFNQLKRYVAKESGGWTGSDTKERPESTKLFYRAIDGKLKRNDAPTWERVEGMVNKMIPLINDCFRSQGKGMRGKTATEVFSERLPADVRRADPGLLQFALTKGKTYTVRQSLVKIGETLYGNEELGRYSGGKVIVRQSLLTDSEVFIHDLNGEYLFAAFANWNKEADDPKAAIEKVKRGRKKNLLEIAQFKAAMEVGPDPEFKTMTDVAANMYRQSEMVDVDAYLLPKAAGGEDFIEEKTIVKPARQLRLPTDAKDDAD